MKFVDDPTSKSMPETAATALRVPAGEIHPRGGPDGGDGGRGGSILAIADRTSIAGRVSLCAYSPARNGERAAVPIAMASCRRCHFTISGGHVVSDIESGELLADWPSTSQPAVTGARRPGRLGNIIFSPAPTARAPIHAGHAGRKPPTQAGTQSPGGRGASRFAQRRQSTYIRSVSAARPKVADYPFTTAPESGVCEWTKSQLRHRDVPGLIEGAAEGAGLGHQFLRHLQRTPLAAAFGGSRAVRPKTPIGKRRRAAIVEELRKYDEALFNKSRWLVLNKVD